MKDWDGNPVSHGGFTGEMSKYETTNAQYCQFLNAALASGDVVVDGSYVKGSDGSNRGVDFLDQPYYFLAGLGAASNGAANGGAARINYSDGVFTVAPGFGKHPVTDMSWYGATAFCNYYGYRLPTEWEWQAVADFDGSYTYGCGTSINNSIANYYDSTHPDGTTTVVGSFGSYGYGLSDMTGNVWEWTSTVNGSDRVIRGGGWYSYVRNCTVSYRSSNHPYGTNSRIGFRVCR
jgi:formylglycine-generating enzyme required for sulfatase activity